MNFPFGAFRPIFRGRCHASFREGTQILLGSFGVLFLGALFRPLGGQKLQGVGVLVGKASQFGETNV